MKYTAAELAELRRALHELATGQRVTQITQNGRTVQFAAANIDQLQQMERQAAADVQRASGGPRSRTRLATTSKGL